MTRLAARQRLQREGGAVRRLRERETVAFRRALYRSGTRVRGVAGAGHQGQQQRDITADSFRRNPVHLNRLRPWLRRELTVLYGAHGSLVDIVQRIIVARLARHGLEDTPTIEEELRQFLLARTDHFLHELVSFARSPLGLDDYDLQAVYEPPAAAAQPDGVSSSDSSSVIAISEGEDEERRAASAHDDVIQTGSNLSLAAWDDETPGPSYSSAEPSCSLASLLFSPAPPEPANEEAGEECLIVGYKKPIAERTPELVQLSSDTEEEKEEELPPLSSLPTIPPSTSAHRAERRSLSGSSGRSGNSVCSLSPATPPGESERRERASGRELRERRRRRRRRGRKSGTLYNPNRSIFPAMMRRRSHSPSPFLSSVDSGSPLPPSPSDSTWEYHCSQLSPLPSSASSSSSSPLCSSPQTPPTPSLSPGDAAAAAAAAHHREKPGGKRKYKSRHLDSSDKDPTWRPSGAGEGGRERRRDGSRRCRDDRSPSVEIIYEGTINATQTAARKRRRKRHRKTQHSSPVIITLDSDSSHDNNNNNNNNHTTTTSSSRLLLSSSSSSSSPLSSQQTVDFSDLPPLALQSAGVGGALNAEIGDELPADILDRGSDGSETEAAGPIAVDNSDQDVDVESVGESGVLLEADTTTAGSEPVGTAETDRAHRGASEVVTSDSRLLAAILSDLKGIAAPNRSSDTRRRLRDPCEVGRAHSDQDGWSAETRHPGFPEEEHRPLRTSAPPLPPLGWLKEGKDVPPLLKQASPVRSYNRNTPPPLKHKDAGSPHRFPVSPADDPAALTPPADSRLGAEPPRDHQAIPSISTLKRSFTSAFGVRSPDHKPPIDPHSFTNSADFFPRLNFNSPHSHKSHSRRDSAGTRSSPILSLSPVGLHHSDSTSGGCRNNRTLNSTDLHPTEGTPAGSGVLSGANCNDASPADRTQTPSSSSTADEHPGRPKSPVDFHSPEHKPPSVNHEENHTAASSSPTQPHNHVGPSSDPPFDPCSKHNPPVDPRPPADNHITSSPRPVDNRWKSNASIDARSESGTPPADERSAGGVWNTHTHSAT